MITVFAYKVQSSVIGENVLVYEYSSLWLKHVYMLFGLLQWLQNFKNLGWL